MESGSGRMNIVYIFPKMYYEKKMSIGRTLYGGAVANSPGVDRFIWWGPGWSGYEDTRSLNYNLASLDFDVDVVWFYKAEPAMCCEMVECKKLVCFNEANHVGKTHTEIEDADATHVVFHHESDQHSWESGMEESHAKILHCADPVFFTNKYKPWGERHGECIFAGVDSPEIYPLRRRLKLLIVDGQLNGSLYQHPGYRLRNREAVVKQYNQYCQALMRHKVLVTCTSKYKYPLAKIIEGMMAGCLVATDMPDDEEFRQNLGKFIIEIEPEWNDLDIRNKILGSIADTAWAESTASAARDYVLKNYATEKYAERLLDFLRT